MSDSGSDQSRHKYRQRRRPNVAFYNQMGGNHFGAAMPYQDYELFYDDERDHIAKRDSSPTPRRCSWFFEAIERLASELNSCGYEAHKESKKAETKAAKDEQRDEKEKVAIIEAMNAKLSKLEDAMKSVQDTIQSCLEKAKKAKDGGERSRERAGNRSPVFRQRGYRSPGRWIYDF